MYELSDNSKNSEDSKLSECSKLSNQSKISDNSGLDHSRHSQNSSRSSSGRTWMSELEQYREKPKNTVSPEQCFVPAYLLSPMSKPAEDFSALRPSESPTSEVDNLQLEATFGDISTMNQTPLIDFSEPQRVTQEKSESSEGSLDQEQIQKHIRDFIGTTVSDLATNQEDLLQQIKHQRLLPQQTNERPDETNLMGHYDEGNSLTLAGCQTTGYLVSEDQSQSTGHHMLDDQLAMSQHTYEDIDSTSSSIENPRSKDNSSVMVPISTAAEDSLSFVTPLSYGVTSDNLSHGSMMMSNFLSQTLTDSMPTDTSKTPLLDKKNTSLFLTPELPEVPASSFVDFLVPTGMPPRTSQSRTFHSSPKDAEVSPYGLSHSLGFSTINEVCYFHIRQHQILIIGISIPLVYR